ncbi:UDP-glucose 4-epimerase GalE [Vibrio parahaemolyticus]|uniref:UDP-glucose 4-epimerase GalE n=1 Tax=Vibrio parahaemolyticus TaxID=670 RepID=UPI0006A7408B|nr:UDP-glucose 4-epimerase GalE [Vibrio parahaemolyticus]EHK9098100.1 UDP-glucose 4-epimerase GalE [Vibrio parahaemolyticus]EIA1331548.1 UDP-glucose 4-epimerase GalE [Vibrio parahaemolyticus]EIT7132511.1 UDP-glucose 4-epimerase GalE [Vibrio parahaemolyticus]EIV8627861.1 UDP-glucose 4-epimerase GalE [Vibrio parahaemolyticus]EJE8563588.1 UDP-glucose 4-epimerase GalE [Vibrio parahaemolyticus]
MKVLVTGGMGYIGSHTCVQMIEAGMEPIIVDNLCNAKLEVLNRIEALTGKQPAFHQGDIRDEAFLDTVFAQHDIQAVIHFAGLKAVGESVAKPLEYYDNNVNGSLVLARSMRKAGVKSIVFSSSATVYGDPEIVPITEDSPTGATTNPYGRSKYMVEQCLSDLFHAENDWSITLLRYFNPVGAHPSGCMGEDPQGIPNNLMPFIAQVAVGRREKLAVFGSDYPTPDGTGVRDYIHVMDLADGHIAALKSVGETSGLHIYNLGTGKGSSVLEMVDAFAAACGKPVPYELCPRRSGDIAECWASTEKAERELGWKATRKVAEMTADTWNWQSNNPSGYSPE